LEGRLPTTRSEESAGPLAEAQRWTNEQPLCCHNPTPKATQETRHALYESRERPDREGLLERTEPVKAVDDLLKNQQKAEEKRAKAEVHEFPTEGSEEEESNVSPEAISAAA
jgi:hypothetical protein